MGKIFACIFGVLALVFGTFWLIHQYRLRKACTVQVRGDVRFIPYEPGSKYVEQAVKVTKIMKPIGRIIGFRKEVEKIEELEKLGPPVMYYEAITFSVNGVERVVKTGHSGSENFKYSMGQNVVTVAYDPSNPDRYRVLEKEGEIILGVMCVALGSIFAMVPWIV